MGRRQLCRRDQHRVDSDSSGVARLRFLEDTAGYERSARESLATRRNSMRCLFVAPFAVVAPAVHASVYLSVEQAQQAIFPKATFVLEELALKQRIWRVSGAGWFIVDQVVGKSELITYAVGLD